MLECSRNCHSIGPYRYPQFVEYCPFVVSDVCKTVCNVCQQQKYAEKDIMEN